MGKRINKYLLYSTVLVASLVICVNTFATDYFFYVQFADKCGTPYSLSNPAGFLSERALERRKAFALECDSTDLPVNPAYLKELVNHGFRIHNNTRWLNGATIATSDSTSVTEIQSLPFVTLVEYTGKMNEGTKQKSEKNKNLSQIIDLVDYGYADAQINQVNGKYLHNQGYRGEDIHIGVLDAGFYNADIMPAFNLLRIQNRLLGTKDFVNPYADIYKESFHGSYVLSTMASDIPGEYIGTAPAASYWLVRTENDASEYAMEMDFWISGIEFLDSVGIDVVNSSLGYTTFDDPAMNLTHADLNGKTARMSRVAGMAAKKGIIVVSSAGNEGNKTWKKISIPSDAEGIITVGAVTGEGNPSVFSGYGPTADGRVKPEVAALGTSTALMNVNGNTVSNGTSFSSPIIAGMLACLLQFTKDQHAFILPASVIEAVCRSADNYDSPTQQSGYGIPDFEKACHLLLSSTESGVIELRDIYVFPDTASGILNINLNTNNIRNTYVQIVDINGKVLFNEPVYSENITINTRHYIPGIYAVRVLFPTGEDVTQKILIR